MSRITLLTALGAVVLAASLVGGVGWITFGPRPNASVAADAPADPPRPAPDAPKVGKPDPDDRRRGEERRQADERRKKLEQFAETLRVEVEALEKNIELLVKASGDDAVRTALQKRLADLEAEITALNRDILRAEAEITVLKKRLDDKNPAPVDAAVLDQLVASDPAVVKAAGDLDKAKAELARALDMVVGKEPPLVGELKRAVERLEKELGERRRTAMQAGAVAARELERAALKRRIADLETTIEVKRAVLEKLKAERDALAKAVRLGADPAPDVQRMRDAIQPQRELLAKLQRELLLERARERGITFTEPAGNDAKLDLILKELAALRKEVQELKDRK